MFALFNFDDKILMELGFFLMLFLSVIIFVHYLFNRKTTALAYISYGNLAYTLFFFVVLFNISNREYKMPYMVAFFDVLSIVMFSIAMLKMFSIKIPRHSLLLLPVLNLLFVYFMQPYVTNFGLYRFVTTLSIVFVIVHMGIRLLQNGEAKTLKSFKYTLTTIVILTLFKLFLSIYRLATFVNGDIWFPKEVSINAMTFVSICLVIWLNFSAIFMSNDLLNKTIKDYGQIDFLTKLPNRRRIYEESSIYFDRFKRKNNSFAVVMLDIDGFKNVNDEFGHDVGDQTLIDLSEVLKSTIRMVDFVGRYGGEEFIILIEAESIDEVKMVIARLVENVKKNHYSEKQLNLTISGGVCFSTDVNEYKRVEQMISISDDKMYEAKKRGKDNIKF